VKYHVIIHSDTFVGLFIKYYTHIINAWNMKHKNSIIQFASYSVLAVTMILLSLFVCLILLIRNEQEVMKSESRNSARTLGEVNLVWVHRVLSP
jgi:hypothetical protein